LGNHDPSRHEEKGDDMTDWNFILELFLKFTQLGALCIGGYSTVLADLQRYLVLENGYLSHREFSSAVAVGQASPGPNYLLVVILGGLVAGTWGVVAAFVGTTIPYLTLTLCASRFGQRYQNHPWLLAYKKGLSPIAIALLCSSGFVLISADLSIGTALVTFVSTILVWKTKVRMLWLMIAGGAIGALGVL
jgi:chromate transporter